VTGTLTVLTGHPATIEYDTDQLASLEAAQRVYDEATKKGGGVFDTTTSPATAIPPRLGRPGETEHADVTIVPRYAGG
jgi:hypothetical protein